MSPALSALPRFGGKSGRSVTGTGRWINSLLPTDAPVYCEPCFGSGGILLQRKPARREIVNDLSGDLINWWLAVRDATREFKHLVSHTPMAAPLFTQYQKLLLSTPPPSLEDMPDIGRALAFHVALSMTWSNGEGKLKGDTMVIGKTYRVWRSERVEALAERMRDIQIFCEDMCNFLERRTADKSDWLIYMDPPYYTADTDPYPHRTDDVPRLTEALQLQQGMVALSGYPGEWDHLGWERRDYQTFTMQQNQHTEAHVAHKRIECLWANFTLPEPEPEPVQLDLMGGADCTLENGE